MPTWDLSVTGNTNAPKSWKGRGVDESGFKSSCNPGTWISRKFIWFTRRKNFPATYPEKARLGPTPTRRYRKRRSTKRCRDRCVGNGKLPKSNLLRRKFRFTTVWRIRRCPSVKTILTATGWWSSHLSSRQESTPSRGSRTKCQCYKTFFSSSLA